MDFLTTIGLEVHVQLRTRSKMFCGCSTGYGAPPNTQVCPVCLGYPGTLPVMNEEAVRLTVLAGLMIGCEIGEASKFDRKSYFYPDMPKNFQISQYDRPLCTGGTVEIETEAGTRPVRIRRIHLEEDVAKSMHFANVSGVDFNRAGVPLMEIVTEPDLNSPEEAFAFLQGLRRILLYAGVSDCNLERGNMRCDVNCSVRPAGTADLGTKTEIKNLNTFKGVLHALQYERERQVRVLGSGGTIEQETRRWDADQGVTLAMRSKEYAHDYRYFPEPDLMPVRLPRDRVAAWRSELPELPAVRRRRFMEAYGLSDYDAGVLVADKPVADYFEQVVGQGAGPKAAANWMTTEMLHLLSQAERDIRDLAMTPASLAGLIRLVEDQTLNSNTARAVFAELVEKGGDPREIVEEQGLAQVSHEGMIAELIDRAVADHPKCVEDYRKGRKAAAKFLVGQVMRMSRGKANPKMVQELIEKRLTEG